MERVQIRFYEELNDFLTEDQKRHEFGVAFELPRSIKDLIESLGVPHVEVDLILVNGVSVDFDHIVSDGDQISVYPMFESLDIGNVTHLRPRPLRTPKFILDVHLHTLAKRLRMLGFDCLWSSNADDEDLAMISAKEHRTLLTRDIGLLKRSVVQRGLHIRATDPHTQLAEVVARLDLTGSIRPFSRCIRCNGELESVDHNDPLINDEFIAGVPTGVRLWCSEYKRCRECGQFYWSGSHIREMNRIIDSLTNA